MAINSLSASSYGLSGLVSGIDTQSVVEKLLSGTQSKIDKAGQKKTVLQYKQQMYRDVAAKLKSLQTSFLSFTSKTNLLSNGFYNTMSATVTPPSGSSAAFSVTASSGAQAGNTTVNYIKQLAQAYSKKTNFDATGKVEGTMNSKVAENLLESYRGEDAALTIKVGNASMTIANAPETFSGMTGTQVAEYLNNNGLKGIGAEARYMNNKLTITANNAEEFISIHGNTDSSAKDKTLAMKMFGEYATLGGKGSFTSSINTDSYDPEFVVNLDGRQQTIKMRLADLENFATTGDGKQLADSLADSLRRTFGSGVQVQQMTDASGATVGLRLFSGSDSQKFTVTGSNKVLDVLGMKTGISNKLNASMALKDLNFATALQGNTHTFTINGVGFSFTADTSLSSVINEINGSKAGVKISYIESEDRFQIENVEAGKGNDSIEWGQTEGNFLSALFGIAGSGSASTLPVYKTLAGASFDSSNNVLANIAKGGAYTFTVNGTDYKFTVKQKEDKSDYTAEEFAAEINKAFKSTFGTLPDGTQSIEFRFNEEANRFELDANNKSMVVSAKADATKGVNLLGFVTTESTQAISKDVTLAEAGIKLGDGGFQINLGSYGTVNLTADDIDADTTMGEMAEKLQKAIQDKLQGAGYADYDKVSVSFDEKTAGFKFMGIDIPMEIVTVKDTGSENLDNLFGTDRLSIGAAELVPESGKPLFTEQMGQNAVLSINGSEIERNSNSFTMDGLTYTLYSTTYKDPANIPENPTASDFEAATKITVSRDTDQIVDGIKEFLKLYNETIDYINELYKAEATYKDYSPLTQAQKDAMSDREIQSWEEKSKEGLLRNDSVLGGILQSMRTALYTKPAGSAIAIYDIGIATSYYANDGNFVEISDGALKAAVENDPEGIRQLFAGEGGLMELLNTSITNATRNSYGNPGTLVAVAGANALDSSSSIYKQIKEVDTQLTSLEDKYWSEYNRYWKQFNAMEQMIQQMNTQSSWLSQQFS